MIAPPPVIEVIEEEHAIIDKINDTNDLPTEPGKLALS